MADSLRDRYPDGSKWKVVKEGGMLSGWKSTGPSSWAGAGIVLLVGEVIECTGYGPGFGSDPGYGIHFRHPELGRTEFRPSQGTAFTYEPAEGYLERIE